MTKKGAAIVLHSLPRFPSRQLVPAFALLRSCPPFPCHGTGPAVPGGTRPDGGHGPCGRHAILSHAPDRCAQHRPCMGIETRIASTTPCQVEMTVNQTIFMAHVPEMVQAGLLNTLVTPALQKQAPHYLMNTVQTDVTPGFVHALFTQNGAPARCHFAWSYIAPDGLPHSMLGFDFTRAAHDHINWDHLRFGDMIPTAQNTVVDPQFDTLVNQETVDVTIALARDHAPGDLPPPGQAAGARP